MDIPFSALSLVHQNLTHLMSSNDDKFDFLDSNVIFLLLLLLTS